MVCDVVEPFLSWDGASRIGLGLWARVVGTVDGHDSLWESEEILEDINKHRDRA